MILFSIIIPTYNRASLLPRAIQSVLAQTYSHWELLVVDDGSTDDTAQQVAAFNDPRIRYLFQENKGVCAARNQGALLAKGIYLIFLDSDDDIKNTWLFDFFNLEQLNYNLIYCSMKIVKPNGDVDLISASITNKGGSVKGTIIPGSWAIEKELFFKVGMFDENLKFGENTELRFRLAQEELSIGIVDQFNFIYYPSIDGGSKNLKNIIQSNLYIIKKHPIYFSRNKHVLRFYYQNIAIAYARMSEWKSCQNYFWKAFIVQPWKLKTLLRYCISLFPVIAKDVWKRNH